MTVPIRRTLPVSGQLTPSEWLAWVQSQVLNSVGSSAEKRQITCAADREPIRLVYGEDRIGAQILNVVPSGVNVLIQCLWCYAGDSVNDVRYNDEALPGSFSVTHYTGSQVTPDAALVAAFAAAGITYADALTGFMYSVVTMPQGEFSESLGITARVKGRKLYDPRKDSTNGGSGAHRLNNAATWEYSTNPSLVDADYLYSAEYGCGKTVDWSTVITAANANDATVSGQPRRVLDGLTIQGMQPVKSVAETLRTYAGCFHLPGANGVQLLPDRPASSAASYSHTAGQIAGLSRMEKRDTGSLPTVMEVIYTNTDAYPWRDDSAIADLPGAGVTLPYRLQQVRLNGIQRYAQAEREAIERLNKLNLTDFSLVLDVFDIGIRHELGDVITIADHPAGLSNKLMRVADAPTGIGKGVWRLPLVEYDPAVYSDAVATAPTYPDTGLASPALVPPDVASLAVTVLADGTRRYTIIVPTGAARGSRIMVRSLAGASSSWGAMSDFFSLDYDPNISTYYRESNLPAGAGTWSFSAKLVTIFGVESATAAVINGAVLGQDPVTYGSVSNLLSNSDWTEDLGHPAGITFYPDTRSLRHWLPGGHPAQYARNYDQGRQWNIGKGGCCIYIPSNTVGHYAYVYQDVPILPGVTYEASVYGSPHRANLILYIQYLDASKSGLVSFADQLNSGAAIIGDPYDPSTHPRLWTKGLAPVGAAYARFIALVECTALSSPYPFSAWSRALLCVAPPGVTKATATPWIEAAQPYPRGVGDPLQVNVSGPASFFNDVIGGNVLIVFGSFASASVSLLAGDTINIEWQFDGTQGTGPVTEPVQHATDIVIAGSGKVPFTISGPGFTGHIERSFGAFWTSHNSTDRFYMTRVRQYTAPSDQTITVYAGCGVANSATPVGSADLRLRVYRSKI